MDLYQPDLEEKIEDILKEKSEGIPKVEITYELRSNHHMTNKVLKKLESDGLVVIEKVERSYRLKITEEGVLHLRKYNEFYSNIFRTYILDHYKFSSLPSWFVEE